MKKIKVGFIGLGQRGAGYLINNYDGLIGTTLAFKNVQITAVCDSFPERVDSVIKYLEEKGCQKPFGTTDYNELLKQDIDAVIISAAWEAHVPLAVAAMKAKIITALEVGGAYSVEDCYKLVETYEETKTPFMFLENCCYGENELLVTNMVRKGLFGEICYCHGSYCHDLRDEICDGVSSKHYRLRNYLNRNCDNYPTHEIGPIAKLLDINRGNKFLTLTSVSSKSRGLEEYVKGKEKYKELEGKHFKQGDVVHTSITCADGTLITIKLATTTPRPYTREFMVEGTEGVYSEVGDVLLCKEDEPFHDFVKIYKNTVDKYKEKYLPKIWKDITEEQLKIGHGGMDYFVLREFFDAISENKEMPIDVYDAASWMCISVLSEQSIANGGTPVAIPDFTNGKWVTRTRKDVTEF